MAKTNLNPDAVEYSLEAGTPRYEHWYQGIHVSVSSLSRPARQLIALALELFPVQAPERTVSFSVLEFCKTIGCTVPDKAAYKRVSALADECISSVIKADEDDGWTCFKWCTAASCDGAAGQGTLTLSEQIAAIVLADSDVKKLISALNV